MKYFLLALLFSLTTQAAGPTYSKLESLKVNRAITATTTVNSNCYAIVDYLPTATSLGTVTNGGGQFSVALAGGVITRHYGPSRTVPTSFTVTSWYHGGGGGSPVSYTITYTLQEGVELINTP